MGNSLDRPRMEKPESVLETLVEGDFTIEAGVTGMQGYRKEMEDQHIHAKMSDAPDHLFLGVFDGHGGKGCAIYVCGTDPKREPSQKSLTEVLQETQEWKDYLASANSDGTGRNIELLKDALTEAFKAIDRQMKKYLDENPYKAYSFGGCTAVTVMITPEWIVCANAGDSRATMCHKGGMHMVLSQDHKPDNEKEKARIEAAGGIVQHKRVDGNLAVSRGLGDFEFKLEKSKEQADQKVSCIPEFYQYKRSPNEEEMIILACDGLWDVFSNDQAIEEVRKIWAEGEKNTVLVAEELIDRSLFAGSEDNISAIVVKMKAAEVSAVGGGVAERRKNRPQGGTEGKEYNLLWSAERGDLEKVERCIDKEGYDRDESDRSTGKAAVHMAAEKGFDSVFDSLLVRECSYDKPDNSGKLPIHLAASNGHTKIVGSILAHDKNMLNYFDKHGKTALYYAEAEGRADTIEFLKSKGAVILQEESQAAEGSHP